MFTNHIEDVLCLYIKSENQKMCYTIKSKNILDSRYQNTLPLHIRYQNVLWIKSKKHYA